MRVAIIGGTGSIGAATAERLLREGVAVTLLSRSRPPSAAPRGVAWSHVDVVHPESVRRALGQFDRVLHLAALLQFSCETDPAQAVRVNIDGTLNVLEACRDLGVRRVVFASSIAVYGERTDTMREEDAAPADLGVYGLTKRMGEALGQRFHASSNLEFVALRYSGVIGPGEATSAGMARVRQQIFDCARGRDVTIDGASGSEWVHLLHVADAAEATCVALLADAPARSIYNVAGPDDSYVSLQGLHDLVREIEPGAGRAIWSGRARSAGPVDVGRIGNDLGWRPTISLREGIRDVLNRRRQILDAVT